MGGLLNPKVVLRHLVAVRVEQAVNVVEEQPRRARVLLMFLTRLDSDCQGLFVDALFGVASRILVPVLPQAVPGTS